jgi:hypothetical protein
MEGNTSERSKSNTLTQRPQQNPFAFETRASSQQADKSRKL